MTANTNRILRLPATEQKVGLKRDAFIASRPRTASPGSGMHASKKAPPRPIAR